MFKIITIALALVAVCVSLVHSTDCYQTTVHFKNINNGRFFVFVFGTVLGMASLILYLYALHYHMLARTPFNWWIFVSDMCVCGAVFVFMCAYVLMCLCMRVSMSMFIFCACLFVCCCFFFWSVCLMFVCLFVYLFVCVCVYYSAAGGVCLHHVLARADT